MRYRILLMLLISCATSVQAMQLTRHTPSKKVIFTLIALALIAQQQHVEAPAVLIPPIRAMPDSLSQTASYAMHNFLRSSHEQHFLHGDQALFAILRIILVAAFASVTISCCFPP